MNEHDQHVLETIPPTKDLAELAAIDDLHLEPAQPKREITYHPTWGGYNNLPQVPGELAWRDYWPRVSTLAKMLDDTSNLTAWKCRKVAQGIHERPVLLDMIPVGPDGKPRSHPDSGTGKGQWNAMVDMAMNTAGAHDGSDNGTRLHDLCEVFDLQGGTFTMDQVTTCTPDELKTVDAYGRAMSASGWEVIPEYMERVVVVPELECAGRLDRIVQHKKTGRLAIGDLKSQKWEPGLYDSIALGIQLATYANAPLMLNEQTWEWEPMPDVDLKGGLIIWIPAVQPGRCEIFYVDLEAGWQMAQDAFRVKMHRKRKGVVYRPY